MEKALLKIIFGCKIFVCQPIFKIFVALFTTFGRQKDSKIIRLYFAAGITRQEGMQKGSFQMIV